MSRLPKESLTADSVSDAEESGEDVQYVDLLPAEIDVEYAQGRWQSRHEYPSEEGAAELCDTPLTAEQFEESIREKGVIQAPTVRLVTRNDGSQSWAPVFGLRRVIAARKVRPDRRLRCPIFVSCGDPVLDDLECQSLNLQENLQRRDLRPWEIAETLFQIYESHAPGPRPLTYAELGKRMNLSTSYVGNLIRIRAKAHPDVWAQFKRWGNSLQISQLQLRDIVALPEDDQLAAWNEALRLAKQRKGGGARGPEKRPGPAKLRKYLVQVETLKGSAQYRRGLKHGLEVALGTRKF